MMLEKLARPILRKTALAMFDELRETWGGVDDDGPCLIIPRSEFPRFITALRDRARDRLKGLL